MLNYFYALDQRIIQLARRIGPTVLRIALAIVFIWFGALKVLRVSPVAELVAQTVYWFDPAWFVPLLGVWEALIGVGLLFPGGVPLRAALALMMIQMPGTFLVLILRPEAAFIGGNLLQLSVLGEFVIKNLVLIAAGIAIAGHVLPLQRATPD